MNKTGYFIKDIVFEEFPIPDASTRPFDLRELRPRDPRFSEDYEIVPVTRFIPATWTKFRDEDYAYVAKYGFSELLEVREGPDGLVSKIRDDVYIALSKPINLLFGSLVEGIQLRDDTIKNLENLLKKDSKVELHTFWQRLKFLFTGRTS